MAEPLDLSMLATLADVVRTATAALEAYDYAAALEATERFFWAFCDDYVELVKDRAYGRERDGSHRAVRGDGSASAGPRAVRPDNSRTWAGTVSARAALTLALDVQLRLFAPFMPFVTEEVWSWSDTGSVHRAAWPSPDELPGGGDPAVLATTATALARLRGIKSDRKLSVRAKLDAAEIVGPAGDLDRLEAARADLAAAGRVDRILLVRDPEAEMITVTV